VPLISTGTTYEIKIHVFYARPLGHRYTSDLPDSRYHSANLCISPPLAPRSSLHLVVLSQLPLLLIYALEQDGRFSDFLLNLHFADCDFFIQGKRKAAKKPQGPKKVRFANMTNFGTSVLMSYVERAPAHQFPLSFLQPRAFGHGEIRQEGWCWRPLLQNLRATIPDWHQL